MIFKVLSNANYPFNSTANFNRVLHGRAFTVSPPCHVQSSSQQEVDIKVIISTLPLQILTAAAPRRLLPAPSSLTRRRGRHRAAAAEGAGPRPRARRLRRGGSGGGECGARRSRHFGRREGPARPAALGTRPAARSGLGRGVRSACFLL